MKISYVTSLEREATKREGVKIKALSKSKFDRFNANFLISIILFLIGVFIVCMVFLRLKYNVEFLDPLYRLRGKGGYVAGVFLIIAGPVYYAVSKVWPARRKTYTVIEQHFNPLRSIKITQLGQIYVLMELAKDEWITLHESVFPELDESVLARSQVVLISYRSSWAKPPLPLFCEGNGDAIPFVQEVHERLLGWELPPDWQVKNMPEIDAWFSSQLNTA